MLPCPLWGDCWTREAVAAEVGDEDAPAPGGEANSPDTRKRRAVRERDDGGKRDPFILNRFEKILAMAEMVNVDRPSDDSEDADAHPKAVREARRLGVAVFGVTVDASAQSYFPVLFGRGGYAIVGNKSFGCRKCFLQSIASWPAEARSPIRLRAHGG